MFKEITGDIGETAYSLALADPTIVKFFEQFSKRERATSQTSIDDFMRITGTPKPAAIKILNTIGSSGLGKYLIGRRSHPTRIEWVYNPVHLSKIAMGKIIKEGEQNLAEFSPIEHVKTTPLETQSHQHLTIIEAKEILARSLGLKPEQIEISIRA